MRTIRITGIDNDLYEEIKKLASEGNRPVTQQVLFMIKDYLAKRNQVSKLKSPPQILLELSGTWEDERTAEEIVQGLKKSRRNFKNQSRGF